MREISREEHELLLNLFILKKRYELYFEFINWENAEYEELMKSADMITLKDCFPMDEYCSISQRNVSYITAFCHTGGEIFKEV